MVYEKLAVQRHNGVPLFMFWDKKCLCIGQDWEYGFLQGLATSKVIILLMSNKVRFNFTLFLISRVLKWNWTSGAVAPSIADTFKLRAYTKATMFKISRKYGSLHNRMSNLLIHLLLLQNTSPKNPENNIIILQHLVYMSSLLWHMHISAFSLFFNLQIDNWEYCGKCIHTTR